MPYKIDIIEEEIIFVKFFGEVDYEENVKARKEVVSINQNKNYYKILADWQEPVLESTISMNNLHEFGDTWPKTNDSKPYIVAILLSKENSDENVRFATDYSRIVASKSGLIAKTFWDVEESINWLKNF